MEDQILWGKVLHMERGLREKRESGRKGKNFIQANKMDETHQNHISKI